MRLPSGWELVRMSKGKILESIWVLFVGSIALLISTIILWSFITRWEFPHIMPEAFSLRTWAKLISAKGSHNLISLTLSSCLLSATVGLLCCFISLCSSRVFVDIKLKHRGSHLLGLIDALGFLPLVVPGTVLSLGAQSLFIAAGISDSIAAIILIHTVVSLPYGLALLSDASLRAGKALEEQAQVLGAHHVKAFMSATLPQLIPSLISSFTLCFVISYSQYFSTLIVGGGKVQTLSLVLIPYIQSGDRALASTYACAFLATALIVFITGDILSRGLRNRRKGFSHANR